MSRFGSLRFPPALTAFLASALLAACAAAPSGEPGGPIVERDGQTFLGTAYRSFHAPYSRVKAATVSAINARSFRILAFGTIANGESIRASSLRQSVDIELERLEPGRAELRVTASGGGLVEDRKAAAAIVAEVARILEQAPSGKR